MGDQAALSGLSRVPQGCLFGADVSVTVCKHILDVWEYGSVRGAEKINFLRQIERVGRCQSLLPHPTGFFVRFYFGGRNVGI